MNPKRIDRKTIYQSSWINLHLDKVQMPGKRIIDPYHVLDFIKESVGVIVVNKKGQVLLVESYRYVTKSIGWEIPAGMIDSGESIFEAARREVREESGFKITQCKLIFWYYPSIGISNQKFHIVTCIAKKGSGKFDKNEVRQFAWFNREQILNFINKNEILDGLTLTGLFLWLNSDLIHLSD